MLLRTFLIMLLVFVTLKLIFGILRYLRSDGSQTLFKDSSRKSDINEMVKDPVCGVYIAASEAYTVPTKNGRLYFCSPECRKTFLENRG
jgi:YHS domain-containing protein